MALKIKIGQSAYDALGADVKKEYKKDGSDYVLDVEGYEDTTAALRARDAANEERNAAKRERDAAVAEKTALEKKVGTLEAANTDKAAAIRETEERLKGQYEKKYNDDIGVVNKKLETATGKIVGSTRDRMAESIAEKISTTPKLLSPIIAARIQVEVGEDFAAAPKILGADGKVSAMTVDDLAKEFQTNKEYTAIMRVSQATGGGSAPRGPGGGRAPLLPGNPLQPNADGRPVDLSKVNPRDLAASIKADREARGVT